MTAYGIMIKTNRHLIRGGELTDAQKANIAGQLLAARSDNRTKQSFYKGVRYPGNIDKNGEGRLYPEYFIPPYNGGKKLETVIPMSPKTHILSANAYELEIIRLLHLFAPDNTDVQDMVNGSLARLKSSCPGNDCIQGECFHAKLPTLRFLAAAAPDESEWIKRIIRTFNGHIDKKLRDKKCHGNVLLHYWLCLSELPLDIATREILKYKDQIIYQLRRSSVINSENDKINRPVIIYALRNTLARLPEYVHIKAIEPYVSDRDGRLHFDMN